MTSTHLTDEQFSDLLAGDNAPQSTMEHLVGCAPCRAELAEVRSAMFNFNEISLRWAEAEAPRRIQTPSRWEIQRRAVPAWGLATVTALAIAAFSLHRGPQPVPGQTTAAITAGSVSSSSENLADDNRLMMSIDQELDYRVQPSIPVSELRATESSRYPARQVVN